jgi:uncharacterized protein (UPF0332 family)
MTTPEKKRTLAEYRLKQAQESLDEARLLFENKKSPRSVINRLYYSMFYSVLALFVYEEYSSSKHSGVIAYFNKKFIKEGIFSVEMRDSISEAFDMRQTGDYREFEDLALEQVEPFFEKASDFTARVKEYLTSRF